MLRALQYGSLLKCASYDARCDWIRNSHAERTPLIKIRKCANCKWGRSLGAGRVYGNQFIRSMNRWRANVLILQSLVSIVLSYQVLYTPETILARPVQEILVLGLLSLIAGAFFLPLQLVESRPFTIILLLIDTAATSSIIYATEQVGSDLYLAYFLIILISASMRTLRLKIIFTATITALYGVMLYLSMGGALFLEGHLIRLSILLIIGVVYSVMSESLEQEREGKLTLIEEMNERRRAEEALKASETLLRALHEITVDTADWEHRLRRMLTLGCSTLELSTGMVTRIDGDLYEIQQAVGHEAKYPLVGRYQLREVIVNGRPNPERLSPSLLQIGQTGVSRLRIS